MLDLGTCRRILGPDAPADDRELQVLVDAFYEFAEALLSDRDFEDAFEKRTGVQSKSSL